MADRQYTCDASFMARFLEKQGSDPLLFSRELFEGKDVPGAKDHTKRVMEVLRQVEQDLSQIKLKTLDALVRAEGTFIGKPDRVIAHWSAVGNYMGAFTEQILSHYPQFLGNTLPTPEQARGCGLIHDLSASYLPYGVSKVVKETPGY